MDFSLITAAQQSLGAIKVIAEGLVSVRDEAKLLQVRIDLLRALFDVSQQMHELQQEIAALAEREREAKDEARQLREAAMERDKYILHALGSGAFVYAQKPRRGQDAKPPYWCQPCYDQGVKAVLRPYVHAEQNSVSWSCPMNDRHYLSPMARAPGRRILNPGTGQG